LIRTPDNRTNWKRMGELAGWLFLFPPVGLWKLWKDPNLSKDAKWRVLLYLFIIPLLAYLAVGLWSVNRTLQRLLP